ncbi:MAG: mechanosensitive ion channel family protein [Proteobacteria bacterium]|nr:mechanosensitive ion channel family protein [Pseudomonadota bacterium]
MAKRQGEEFWVVALNLVKGPTGFAAALLGLDIGLAGIDVQALALPVNIIDLAHKLHALAWITVFAWAVLASGGILAQWFQRSNDILSDDNLRARKIITQVRMFRRVFSVIVLVVSLAATLMVFDVTRNIGASVLASAGIAGAVAGLSAQKFLSTIFAGMQIAITQPIRLDDVVVVEGEWGRVEEITLTYVVVRIWDQRRLVVPVMYFLDKPIQNWTRSSAEILGSVFLCVDYRAPVAELRSELERLCREEAGELWDGRVCGLQVTDSGPATVTLRALVSSAGSSRNWDLRCLVRERLVCYIQEKHPDILPLTRISFDKSGPEESKEMNDG